MKKQELVLEQYPDAVQVEVPPIWDGNNNVPLEPGYCVVYASRYQGADELGRGDNHAAAWADAAGKLEGLKMESALEGSAQRTGSSE